VSHQEQVARWEFLVVSWGGGVILILFTKEDSSE